MAVRQNTQRAFLFVSKVLGKHLPVEPAALLAAGKLLALAWLDQKDEQGWAGILKGSTASPFFEVWDRLEHSRYSLGMEDRTLFLGFAETATGLARAVADCFDGEMAYISTTRVDRAGASPLTFDEAHSHARTHRLYLDPHDPFMATCQQVVLVDDELTTGNTALRLIRQLHAVYGIRRFTLMVLVDNSEGGNRRAIEQELGIEIRVFSLLTRPHCPGPDRGIASPVPIRLPRCRWGSPCASLAARQRPFRPDLAKRQRSGAPARPLPFHCHSTGTGPIRDVNSLSGRWGIYLRSGPHLWILRGTCVPLYHAKPGVPHGWFRNCIRRLFRSAGLLQSGRLSIQCPGPCLPGGYPLCGGGDPAPGRNRATGRLPQKQRDWESDGGRPMNWTASSLPPHLGSFDPDDVILLLKDVTGQVEERDTALRERDIQAGRHYSEDLPIEQVPSPAYEQVFEHLMETQLPEVALYTGVLTRLVLSEHPSPVLVSLVRAGVPCGVLMRRYAARELGRDLPHYGVSIIRGKGFDENAIRLILQRHPGQEIVFVDGWTGKGMITHQLEESCAQFNVHNGTSLRPTLAVLADPAHSCSLYATREDFVNPSCCLNSTICGLISRTVHNKTLIGPDDFHGVRVYWEFAAKDQTARYLDGVCRWFAPRRKEIETQFARLLASDRSPDWSGMQAVRRIGEAFGVHDINRIKPSIGETTRVLLRRVPDRVLLREANHPDVAHITLLAKERHVPITIYPEMPYLCCGLIADKRGGAE